VVEAVLEAASVSPVEAVALGGPQLSGEDGRRLQANPVAQAGGHATKEGTMLRKYVLIGLVTALLVPTCAFAENLTFMARSFHKNQVDIAFYSENLNRAWPGGDKAWIIADYDVHSYTLSCIQGERVCYGAWVRGSTSAYWGSGLGGKQPCQACCFVCNGGTTPTINLNAK